MMWNGAIYVIIKTCREHAVERKNGAIYVIKTCGEHHTRCGKEKRSHLCHQSMRGASYTLWKNGAIYVIKTCGEHHTRCGKEKRSHLCHQNMRRASAILVQFVLKLE